MLVLCCLFFFSWDYLMFLQGWISDKIGRKCTKLAKSLKESMKNLEKREKVLIFAQNLSIIIKSIDYGNKF